MFFFIKSLELELFINPDFKDIFLPKLIETDKLHHLISHYRYIKFLFNKKLTKNNSFVKEKLQNLFKYCHVYINTRFEKKEQWV